MFFFYLLIYWAHWSPRVSGHTAPRSSYLTRPGSGYWPPNIDFEPPSFHFQLQGSDFWLPSSTSSAIWFSVLCRHRFLRVLSWIWVDFGSGFGRILRFFHYRWPPFSEHDVYTCFVYSLTASSFRETDPTRILLGSYYGLSTLSVFRKVEISHSVHRFRHRFYQILSWMFRAISDSLEV